MKYKHIGQPSDQKNDSQSKLDDSLSRRSFLRNSSTASVGAGLIVTSKTALGQEGSDKGKKVRCGIVGYGDEGKALRESSMFLKDLVCFPAVSDIWPRNLRAGKGQISASKQGGGADGTECNAYADPAEMIEKEDLDCIIVATPDFVHHTYSIMGLEKGLDVYCEKLMSNSIDSARQMVEAQKKTGKLLAIGHQRRSNPRYLHVKNEILGKRQLLGWITHMTAQWNRSRGGSVPREIPMGKDALSDEILQKFGYNGGAKGMFEFRNWRMYKKLFIMISIL